MVEATVVVPCPGCGHKLRIVVHDETAEGDGTVTRTRTRVQRDGSVILRLLAERFNVTLQEYVAKSSRYRFADVRDQGMWIFYEIYRFSFPGVARTFNRSNHTTARSAYLRVEERRRISEAYRHLLDATVTWLTRVVPPPTIT